MPSYMLFHLIFLFMSAALAVPQSASWSGGGPVGSRSTFPEPPPNSTDQCAILTFQFQSKVYPNPNGCVTGQQGCCCESRWVEVDVDVPVPASSRSFRTPATKTASYACCYGGPIERPNGYRTCETGAARF